MQRPVSRAEDGFTLVEFLVAVVILTVGLLGLLKSVNIAIMQNMTNKNRENAIMLADQLITVDRARPFADVSSVRRIAPSRSGLGFVNYSVAKNVVNTTTTTKTVTLRIRWREKEGIKEHQLTSLISN